jgi:hypothetical protein
MGVQEGVDLGQDLRPGGVALREQVVGGVERDQPSSATQPCDFN